VELSSEITIHADLLVKNFGAQNGMLIITNYSIVKPHLEQIKKFGYGFCVLDNPDGKIVDLYNRKVFIEMLSDWGWSGEKDKKPKWLVPPSE
jgi:hypothetical protein